MSALNPLLSLCPVCSAALDVTRLSCARCETTIEGRFAPGPFARLSSEQLRFVEAFVRCEGKLSHLEGELGMSYPTLRSRLHEIIQAMGYQPRDEVEAARSEAVEARRAVLVALEQGRIDAETATRRLRELGG